MIKTLNSFDLKDKRVLLRVDYNVPIVNDKITDNFRIASSLPTIKYCIKSGAKIIIMSHLGRPKGDVISEMSLISAGESLADLLEMPIKFSHDCVSEDAHDVTLGLRSGEIHLLENLRFHIGEEKNDNVFCKNLAKHGEIYINDAFGTAHRSHASNAGITSYFSNKGMGLLFEKELEFLSNKTTNPKKPLTVVLGGAKIDSKLKLINHFISLADNIIISGGMAFTFLKARGINVGKSLVDDSFLDNAKNIFSRARGKVNLFFPKDFLCSKSLELNSASDFYDLNKIPSDHYGVDIGPKTIKEFSEVISNSRTILWNGPMGIFEVDGFHDGTEHIAKKISEETQNEIITIVGGGDSVSAIKKFGLINDFSHISTGGGASLELLSGETLPAIYALEV